MGRTVPKTMRAAVMTGIQEVKMETRKIPDLSGNDILVKVLAVGVCGSDVHYFEKGRIGDAIVDKPIILGHELSGEVVSTGENVKRLKIGDRVAIEPGVTCGHCDMCKEGRYNLCPEVSFFATPPVDGAFCEYIKIREDFAFLIPDFLSYDEAAFVEPLSVGIHAANRSGLKPGSTVAIMGMGPVGLMAVIAAKEYGATKIIVSDMEPNRLEAAKKLGATDIINISKENANEVIAQLTDGIGVDIAWETAGNANALHSALKSLRRGGKLAIIGLPPLEEIPFNVHTITGGEVDIIGIFRYANTYPKGIGFLASGKYDVKNLITHKYLLEETQEALEQAMTNKSGSIKVMVYPNCQNQK